MKFFFYTLGVIGLVVFGWHYAPAPVREKTATLLNAAMSRSTGEIKSTVVNLAKSQNPVETRAKIIGELKKNIMALKRNTPVPVSVSPKGGAKNVSSVSAEQLIISSEELIKQLESSNENSSLAEKIENRIIEMALPVKNNCPAPEK